MNSVSDDAGILFAFYDLNVAPVTFDFLQFLVLAESHRQESGCRHLVVVVVCADEAGRSAGLKDNFTEADRDWRLSQILLPACTLLPSCAGRTMVCADRAPAEAIWRAAAGRVYPLGYRLDRPVACFQLAEVSAATACGLRLPTLTAPPAARAVADRWVAANAPGAKLITITLREAPYGRERNSDIAAWGEAARGLAKAGYVPVVIRDSYAVCAPVPDELRGIALLNEAAVNLELRMAFYQAAYLNLFTNGGPQMLCHLGESCRALVFKPMVAHWHDATAHGLRRGVGVEIGEQPCFLPPEQRWVWADDTPAVILEHVELMADYLDHGPQGALAASRADFFRPAAEPPERLLRLLESTGSWDGAARILRHLLAVRPDDGDLLLRLGICETWRRNFDLAGELIDRVRAERPGSVVALNAAADLSLVRGDADQGIRLLHDALRLEPSNARSNLALGMVYESLGNALEAIPHLRRCLTSDPGNVKCLRVLARILDAVGAGEAAAAYRARADAIEPEVEEHSL